MRPHWHKCARCHRKWECQEHSSKHSDRYDSTACRCEPSKAETAAATEEKKPDHLVSKTIRKKRRKIANEKIQRKLF